MKHFLPTIILTLSHLTTLTAFAGFDEELASAGELYRTGQRTEAIQKCVRLADRTQDRAQQTDALRQAAAYADAMRDYEEAMALARRIPDDAVSKTMQMRVLYSQSKWTELYDRYCDENIVAWPPSVRGDAFMRRGTAAKVLGHAELARSDFERAAASMPSTFRKAGCLKGLGDVYRDLFDDDTRALAAYRTAASAHRSLQTRIPPVVAAAEILLKQGKVDEAVREIDAIDTDEARGAMYGLLYLKTRATVMQTAGRNRDAAEALRQALRIPSLPDDDRSALQAQVSALLQNSATDLVLAADGTSAYQVVIPDTFPDTEIEEWIRKSADLLQHAFATNGFEIAVTTEADRDPDLPGIFLGDTAFARAHGMAPTELPGWSYVHNVVGRDMIIAGADLRNPVQPKPDQPGKHLLGRPRLGTVKAVTAFLHRYVRTRFLFTGDNGIVFLPTPAITVPVDLDTHESPAVTYNYSYFTREGFYEIANNYLMPFEYRLGAHTWPYAVPLEEYGQSHPEYFALTRGTRCSLHKDPEAQYCFANPAGQELVYRYLRDMMDMGYEVVSLGQSDGFRGCQCDLCRALYDTDGDWTEKIWVTHRNIAERLLQSRPDKKVMLLAYGQTWDPPRTFTNFPANTMVQLTHVGAENMEAWSGYNVPHGYTGYLYMWGSTYSALAYTPKNTPAGIERLVKRLSGFNVKGVFLDGFGDAWGLEGPAYYVYGRLWDDPENLEAKDLLEEFYEAAYGPASDAMRAFFGTLHHSVRLVKDMQMSYTDVYGRKRRHFNRDPLRLIATIYAPDTLEQLDADLRRAEELADAAPVHGRLRLARIEFDYLRHIATIGHLYDAYRLAPTEGTRETLLDAVDAWNAFLDSLFAERNFGPYFPGGRPFSGHARMHVSLSRNVASKAYADTPLNWDTTEIRKQPVKKGGLDDAREEASRMREDLYETGFKVPDTWKNLTELLPADAWGTWRFRADPADQGVENEWFAAELDAGAWMEIPVPAFWSETSLADYTGYGWYRVSFELPADGQGRGIRILFGAVDEQAWVYVNGRLVREHTIESEGVGIGQLWEAPFAGDVAPEHLVYGGKNTLAVRVHNSVGPGGIWRPVLVHVIRDR